MDGLAVGRIVHVVAQRQGGDSRRCQPAIVVRVWPNEYGDQPGINAQVFRDGTNDDYYDGRGGADCRWVTSIREGDEPNQFHDPRGCERTG